MTIAEILLTDFDTEAISTRRMLERIPADKATWKPHEKSMPLGNLAAHIAGMPHFGLVILTTPAIDMGKDKFPRFEFTTAEAAVEHAAGAAAEVRTALSAMSDEDLHATWKLSYHGNTIAEGPKVLLYRTMFFNHLVHHRGQLGVYLRLLDVPVPGIYGPSADEPFKS